MRHTYVWLLAGLLGAPGCKGGADGAAGRDGEPGATGKNGHSSLVRVSAETAGANCTAGGQKIETGIDTNDSGGLDTGEVSQTSYVCGGSAGTSHASLIRTNPEPAGTNCAHGGVRVQSGSDTNGNSVLDDAEVNATAYVCDGAAGQDGVPVLVTTSAELAGANCEQGGLKVLAGKDTNNDGTLQPSEVSSTSYVCNGAPGADSPRLLIRTEPAPSSPSCTGQGTLVTAGLDLNGNAVLDASEVQTSSVVCSGSVGPVLIRTQTEIAGVHCRAGGVKIDSGLDANGNATLDAAEVTSSVYVCSNAPPVGNACNGAQALVPGVQNGNTAGRGDGFQGCTLVFPGLTFVAGQGAEDQAWSLNVDHRQRVTLTVTGFDAAIYLLEGPICAAAELRYGACSDNYSGNVEALSVILEPGQYWVIVDGYTSGGVSAGGEYALSVVLEDPCGEDRPMGRCLGSSSAVWCIAPPAGVMADSVATHNCLADEVCRTVEGQSSCFPSAAATACSGPLGQTFCRDAFTRAQCAAGGTVTTQACQFGCAERLSGAYCRDGATTSSFQTRFLYEYRPPLGNLSDWQNVLRQSPVQRAVVVSYAWNGATYDAVDISTTDTSGNVEIQIRQPIDANDQVVLYAEYDRPVGGGIGFVVAEPAAVDGVNAVTTGITAQAGYSWTVSPATQTSGRTVIIHEAQGSYALRVFDGVRLVYENTANLYYRTLVPKSLIAWLRPNSSWSCGECLLPSPAAIYGVPVDVQLFINGNAGDAQYWSDSVTFHEAGHWTMASFGQPPGEAGSHYFGVAYYPGLAWSEGWATWHSSSWRQDSRYIDKQGGTMFWFDIDRRVYGPGAPWQRPVPANGLLGRMDENEVSAMLWQISSGNPDAENSIYSALSSPRARLARRGYTRRTWDVDAVGQPFNVVNTGIPAAVMPDFLDALVCGAFPANIRSVVDSATEPTTHYAYPSGSPICN